MPTIGLEGSLYPGRISYAEYGLPPNWQENMPNAKHVLLDLGMEQPTYYPYFTKYQEWSAIWRKWADPIFVEGEPDIAAAFAGLQQETNELLGG
ncbi:hypothetical protein KFU94_54225 [Chloroflexi bacterium TSY]|nr:hypothetical protein [Chloroflexi bacterium TSY]